MENMWRSVIEKEAIRYAVDHAEVGDVIVLAGKGHRGLSGDQRREVRYG